MAAQVRGHFELHAVRLGGLGHGLGNIAFGMTGREQQ